MARDNFNNDIYQRYINRLDFVSAANYLSQYRVTDAAQQQQVSQLIQTLRQQGRKLNGLMPKASQFARQGIAFKYAFDAGRVADISNPYVRKWNEVNNNLLDKTGDALEITFNEDEDVKARNERASSYGAIPQKTTTQLFYEQLGIHNVNDLTKLIGKRNVETINGQLRFKLNKNDKNYNNVLRAISNAGYNRKGLDEINYDDYDNNIEIRALDRNGKYIGNTHRGNEIKVLTDIYDQAARAYNEFFAPKGNEREVAKSMIVTRTLGAKQARLQDCLDRGWIDQNTYDKKLKDLDQEYTNQIISEGLSQYKIYANDVTSEDDHETLRELDTAARVDLETMMRQAASGQGANLTYQAAMVGNEMGTLITIVPKPRYAKGVQTNDTSITHQFFIPNMFQDKAEETLRRDTKTRAAMELNEMDAYGYDFDTVDGRKIRSIGNGDYVLSDKHNRSIQISRADAQREINRGLIIEDGIDLARQSAYLPTGEKRQFQDVEAELTPYCATAMNEIYPEYTQMYQTAAQQGNEQGAEEIKSSYDSGVREMISIISQYMDFDNL